MYRSVILIGASLLFLCACGTQNTVTVTNDSATAVDLFTVRDRDRVLWEKNSMAPGTEEFTFTVKGDGDYSIEAVKGTKTISHTCGYFTSGMSQHTTITLTKKNEINCDTDPNSIHFTY